MNNTMYQLILRDRATEFERAALRRHLSEEYRARLQAHSRAARNIDDALLLADLPKDATAALLDHVETARRAIDYGHAWARVEMACYTEALDIISHPNAPDTTPPLPPSPLYQQTNQ